MKYVKTTPIEAEQFDGWMKTAEKYHIRIDPADDLSGIIDELVPRGRYYLKTLEGELEIHQGDWIATGVDGEHWAIKDDIFKKSYSKLPVIPKAVSNVLIYAKRKNRNLTWVFTQTPNDLMRLEIVTQSERQKVSGFFRTSNSNEIFARAWLDGYQVDSDK